MDYNTHVQYVRYAEKRMHSATAGLRGRSDLFIEYLIVDPAVLKDELRLKVLNHSVPFSRLRLDEHQTRDILANRLS